MVGGHTFQLRHSIYFCHQYQPVASAIWTPVSPSVKLKLTHFLEELQTALPPQAWMAEKLTKKNTGQAGDPWFFSGLSFWKPTLSLQLYLELPQAQGRVCICLCLGWGEDR